MPRTLPSLTFLPGDICQLTSAPPHQVLTPQLISKEPALPAEPNLFHYPSKGSWGWLPGRGSEAGRDPTNLPSPHRLLLVSKNPDQRFSLSLPPFPHFCLYLSFIPSPLTLPFSRTARAPWI